MFSFNVEKFPYSTAVVIILFVFAAMVAPYWFLFQFYKPIFYQTDILKLLFVCFAIGFPVVLFNSCIFLMLNELIFQSNSEKGPTSFDVGLVFDSSLFTVVIFYFPCIMAASGISPRTAINLCVVMEAIVLIAFVIGTISRQKQQVKNNIIPTEEEHKGGKKGNH